jgi:uncharacterized protein (TIGR03083 family)
MTTAPAPTPTHHRPRRSTLDLATAHRLAETEYQRVLAALRRLAPGDWRKPTACTGWDVRALATHLLGMAEMAATMRENLRQNLTARRRGGVFIDALTALQVEEHAHLTPEQIVERFAEVAPRAARARARTPRLVRRLPMPQPEPFPGDTAWTFGYLIETILTRDPWMHRVDIADATDIPLELTPDHDGVLVADVAAEWASRHAQPCTLRLTGPAGGRWTFGHDGAELELDAIDFCRRTSGRAPAAGLFRTQVPF